MQIITHEDRSTCIPFNMNSRPATALHCVIHDVVMDERKVVEHLGSESGRKSIVVVGAGDSCSEHEQRRAKTLSAAGQNVAHGLIQFCRMLLRNECREFMINLFSERAYM